MAKRGKNATLLDQLFEYVAKEVAGGRVKVTLDSIIRLMHEEAKLNPPAKTIIEGRWINDEEDERWNEDEEETQDGEDSATTRGEASTQAATSAAKRGGKSKRR